MKRVLNIGLFGFGTVGRGLYDVLEETRLKEARIKRICVRNINKQRGVEADFTDNPDDIFNDPDINLIVELIDDAEASYTIVKRALERGLPVVTLATRRCSHTTSRSSSGYSAAHRLRCSTTPRHAAAFP